MTELIDELGPVDWPIVKRPVGDPVVVRASTPARLKS